MKDVVFITGNAGKAKYFSELIGLDIKHQAVDVHEIQSLDLEEIIVHKAKTAYQQIKKPVLVEDTSLIINSLGRLPGPLIKWFLDELGAEKICRLADINTNRSARAECMFGYFDGEVIKVFRGGNNGTISQQPIGETGFGWNPIFIPDGCAKTLGEMSDEDFKAQYIKIKPFNQIKEFLLDLA